ncbi:MAG: efflux RND transporter periplasmic adaptor subunit [Gemmatimonas sp.]
MTNTRALMVLMATAAIAGCQKKEKVAPIIGSAQIERRTITVDAVATGAVEPVYVVEVKSKAGGQITKMPVETGTQVRQGQLLVQIDTRDVQNAFEQAEADVRSAKAQLDVAEANKKRSDELFKSRVITNNEYEAATLQLTQAQAGIVRANTNLDLAKQRLEEATVVAPLSGTVIERPVSEGMVISGATGNSATGGTTLLKMADLSRVQMRVLVNETDIGNIHSGQNTRVVVDAYPERPFQGTVEKIEPQAIIQQSVTMFPVIVSLRNDEGYLKPGMNGEVTIVIDSKQGVLAVPNDAVKQLREAGTAAALVGLNPDTVQAFVRAEQAKMAAGRGGANGGGAGRATDGPATTAVAAGGEAAGANAAGANAGGGEARGGRRGGDSNRVAGGGEGRRGGRGQGEGGGNAGGGQRGAMSNAMTGGPRTATRTRQVLVFVQNQTSKLWEPRIVRIGASNYDYAEVVSGLEEGETVATLAVATLQARRDAQNDRMRQQQGGGVPGMSAGAPPGGGGGGGGGRGAGGGGRGGD